MKKTILTLLALSLSTFAFSQVKFGIKGHMIYPAGKATWTDLKNNATTINNDKGKNNIGYNGGISLKIETPTAFFVMPELYYTTFSTEVTEPTSGVSIKANTNRADLPVLLGMNVVGEKLSLYAGPVGSYQLASENQYNDFKENAEAKFTVGYQFGLQATLSKFTVSARYEGAFSEEQREFISSNVNYGNIRYDNRQSLILLGVGVQF